MRNFDPRALENSGVDPYVLKDAEVKELRAELEAAKRLVESEVGDIPSLLEGIQNMIDCREAMKTGIQTRIDTLESAIKERDAALIALATEIEEMKWAIAGRHEKEIIQRVQDALDAARGK